MDPVSSTLRVAELRTDLSLLASPGQVQEEWLDANGYPIDELYLQLVDMRDVVVPSLIDAGAVSADFVIACDDLLEHLGNMGGMRSPLWTDRSSLVRAPEWSEARRLAAHAENLL